MTAYQTEESINYNNQNRDMIDGYINLAIAVAQNASYYYKSNAKKAYEIFAEINTADFDGDKEKAKGRIQLCQSEMKTIEEWFMKCSWLELISTVSGKEMIKALKEKVEQYEIKEELVC